VCCLALSVNVLFVGCVVVLLRIYNVFVVAFSGALFLFDFHIPYCWVLTYGNRCRVNWEYVYLVLISNFTQLMARGRNYLPSALALFLHMFWLASSRVLPAWKGTCYFLAAAFSARDERLVWAHLFFFHIKSLDCLTHSLLASDPLVSDTQTLNFFAARASTSSSSSLACLAGFWSLFLANSDLHLPSTTTMPKRKPSEIEVEEVQAKSVKKSKSSMNTGMSLFSFTFYLRCFVCMAY
jgi:hypothetical protein